MATITRTQPSVLAKPVRIGYKCGYCQTRFSAGEAELAGLYGRCPNKDCKLAWKPVPVMFQ